MWSGASYYGNDGIAALYFNTDDKIHMYFDGNTHPYGPINSRCLQRYNELVSYRQAS